MTQRKRTRLVTIAVIVVAALVAALVGGEIYVRNRATTCLAQSFESELGTGVDVDLSWKPVLLQLVDKQIPSVTLDSDDSAFGPAKEMQVHAVVRNVDLRETAEGAGTIGSSSAEVDWPTSGILATVQSQSVGALISDVTADPEAGTLTFVVGGDGLAELTVRPTVADGMVAVQTVDASVLGFGLPNSLVDGIVEALTSGLQQYPLGMKATSLSVTDSGVRLTLDGGSYVLPENPEGAQQQNQGSCGVLA